MVGVGITPPVVLGTPKPASSVIISKMFGAFEGGTIRGAHQVLDVDVFSPITPPNLGSGAGNCSPLIVVVAEGEPIVPLVSIWAIKLWPEIKKSDSKENRSLLIFIRLVFIRII
jgi:hypothetical protein